MAFDPARCQRTQLTTNFDLNVHGTFINRNPDNLNECTCGQLVHLHPHQAVAPPPAQDAVTAPAAPEWFAEMQIFMEQQRQAAQQAAQLQQQAIYRRTYKLHRVNVALETFALPNGVRRWIVEAALRSGVAGVVHRIQHFYVGVVCEGTRAQLQAFHRELHTCLDHICDQIEVTIPDTMLQDITYAGFSITKNIHRRCHENPLSDGGRWEKNSSSCGDTE